MAQVSVNLSDEQLEEIARRVASLATAGFSEPPSRPSPYLTIAEAAEHLRCKRQRIDDLLSSGRLTRVKEGGRTLVLRAEIDAHLRVEARSSVAPALPRGSESPTGSGLQG